MREWRRILIVVILVGIFGFVSCSGQKKKIAKAEMDIRNIRMALIGYAMHDGKYPTTEQGLQALIAKPTLPPEPTAWNGPYLDPDDLVDPWDNRYVYRSPSIEDPERYRYDLYSYGSDRKEGGGDDITVRDIEKLLEQR
jgi:general secretion pathway protein G